ncbi:hypothetical protein EMPS_01728 [Entomortierella parvispora]|uniref:Disease resistance R13L4/SHOC-2-like LRR domain-containing protein n=1 Tax=Entomortierella parvispora TaxID=205924 RepID=A0A9P3LT26_9FUNG|nr:hypothetical protein EMPS_01728 [Entomortierella parvispora]
MAKKNRQRIPLQQANGAPTAATVSNLHSPSSSAPAAKVPPASQRASTSSSLSTSPATSTATSNYPLIPSSSTTSITSITSIPSITSIESASTIIPSFLSSPAQSRVALQHNSKQSARSSSNNNRNINGALTTGGRAQSSSTKQRTSYPDNRTTNTDPPTSNASSSAPGSMLLPRLPSLDDLELPFLDGDSFSSAPASSTTFSSSFAAFLPSSSSSSSAAATSPANSSSYSRPVISSFSPTSSQYLTSQSSRVQDFQSPSHSLSSTSSRPLPISSRHSSHSTQSNLSNSSNRHRRPPSMYSQTTTIDATGTVHQPVPQEMTLLEASDYFINNKDDDLLPKRPTLRSGSNRYTEDNSTAGNNDPLDSRGRTQRPLGSDDLLSPPRYVIRQPSVSALSKTSRATSPSPSLTSSVLSDDSSIHSSHQHSLQQLRHQRQLQRPTLDSPALQRQQQGQQQQQSIPIATSRSSNTASALAPIPVSSSSPAPAPAPVSEASMPKQVPQSVSSAPPEQLPKATSSINSSSQARHSSSSASASPASTSTTGSKRVKALKQPDESDSSSPNLRARLSKLFRPSPKQQRMPSTDQQYRDQQKAIHQDSVRSISKQQQEPRKQEQEPQKQFQMQQQAAKAQERQVSLQQVPQLKPVSPTPASVPSPSQLSPAQTSPRPLSLQTNPSEQMTEPNAAQTVSRTQTESTEPVIEQSTTPNDTPASSRTRSRKVSTIAASPSASTQPIFILPPFAPGFSPTSPTSITPPISPLTRSDNKARQRRVSSVSSSHSIRQVGTYGGDMSPTKMISPARKANPYYSGVLARFSNTGTRHSLHEREQSASGKRRSVVNAERAKVGVEGNNSSREKLDLAYKELQESTMAAGEKTSRPRSVASTTSSIVSEAKEQESLPTSPVSVSTKEAETATAVESVSRELSTPAPAPPLLFSATYEEEYDVEKDSVQNSPFITKGGIEPSPLHNGRTLFNVRPTTPLLTKSVISPPTIENASTPPSQVRDRATNDSSQDSGKPQSSGSTFIPSRDTTWSVASGIPTDNGTIPGSNTSTFKTDPSYSRAMPSFESQVSDSETTPSVSTLSTRDYRAQGVIIEEPWDDSESQHDPAPPTVLVQRPSMDVSILPDQPPFMRPRSTASSVYSTPSVKGLPIQPPKRVMSVAQWSESSYDPCAPIRWDELFEMDPNSKGPLWLSGRGLGQIPHEFFDGLRNLRELYLDHNDIKIVPDSLLKLSKLDVLDLSCNSISSFHAAFKLKKLKNLRRLNLDHNMLTDISPIYKLKALRELRMNHNFVPYLAIAIQNMSKLKILAMESNSLATLPETMGKLGNLCELRLSHNNLRALPESIGSIRTLQVLALRSNLLEKLPESWKDMENLSTLDLSCNRLTVLPQDIVRLPKLTHLDLHDNQIQLLPEKIGQLSNLVVLQLCNNNLQELPKDIGRLRDLHDLVLSFNQLQVLPEEIGKLNKLQELKFDNNPLRSLPKTIQRLVNVRRVHLQGCELRDLPVELGTVFKELVYLDLSCNQFEVLPALDQMHKLEEFYISNNFLREIGTSSLNLQISNNSNNNYNTGTLSGPMGGGIGLANGAQIGGSAHNTLSKTSGQNAGDTQTNPGTLGNSVNLTGGGVTASKLSELKRLRIFEARNNQIRVLSGKIKMLPRLEVLDLANNLLSWLPQEVGDLADLKVLVVEGNPIKSLPSSLSKLMGSLEIFRIGDWPDNGFEITREQAEMNMKINVLQSFMPHQIERTLLWRMHDSILRRVQELDSQRYRDQHNLDKNDGSGPTSRALISGPQRANGSSSDSMSVFHLARSSSSPADGNSSRVRGISQGLAIATQNMMINRSFVLPPLSSSAAPGHENSTASTVSMSPESGTFSSLPDQPRSLLSVNSEGINPNYVDYPLTIRTMPTLQFSSTRNHHSAPITSLPMTDSPLTASVPTGPLSAFPLLNSLRPRKSQQQLQGGKGSVSVNNRPKSMYTYADPLQDGTQEQPQTRSTLNHRVSRVFEFASGGKGKHESTGSTTSTLESSTLQLSSDAMMALGLGTQPGSAGSVITHSNHLSGSRLGDGSLSAIKSSMAIKSSPSLTSVPLPLFSRPLSPNPGTFAAAGPSRPSVSKPSKTSFGRPTSPLPRHVYGSQTDQSNSYNTSGGEKSTTSLPWLRLKSSTAPFSPSQESQKENASAAASITSVTTATSSASLLLPAPPPILLDVDTSSLLDIPQHMYYSAGGDDVDGDHPAGTVDENEDQLSRLGDGLGIDGDTEEDDRYSTSTTDHQGRGSSSHRSSMSTSTHHRSLTSNQSTPRASQDLLELNRPRYQQPQNQLNTTDPVLKIAVLKGIYDQILQDMDHLVEQNVQESPAAKKNRFKLLSTLKFLKADRHNSQGGSSHHHHQHHGSLSSTHTAQHHLQTMH